MARNQEKAQTMLARFLRQKREEEAGPKKIRPSIASNCDDINDAERWSFYQKKQIKPKNQKKTN